MQEPDRTCHIWQDGIGSTGSTWPGANNSAGYCDTDVSYLDYAAVVKEQGLNGWGKAEEPEKPAEPEKPSQPAAKFQKGDRVKVLKAVQYDGGTFGVYYDSYDVLEVSGDRVVIGIGNTVTAAVHADNLAKAGMSASAAAIKVGDKVRVKQGAKDYNSNSLASFVYQTVYTVLEVSGKRAVIGLNGAVTAAISTDNLYKA